MSPPKNLDKSNQPPLSSSPPLSPPQPPPPSENKATPIVVGQISEMEQWLASESRLDLFFQQSLTGIFFMMLDEPIVWNDSIDKEEALDYAFNHQHVTRVNQAMLDQYHISHEAFLSLTPHELFAHDIDQGHQIWRELFDTGRQHFIALEERFDGTPMWVEGDYTCLHDEQRRIIGHFGTQQDVTARVKLESALYTEKELFKTTLLCVGDGIISTDQQGNVQIINPVAELLTGWSAQEACGLPLDLVFKAIHTSTGKACENMAHKVLKSGVTETLTDGALLISKDSTETPIEDSAAPIFDEHGRIAGVVLVFRDSTIKKQRLREIEYLSFHDQLTGLYNRRFYEEELARLDTARNMPLTLVMGDINGLKLINDSFGHATGDEFLIKVSHILFKGFRSDDIVARVGGDEFIIILPQTDAFEAGQLVNRIRTLTRAQKVGSVPVSISFGFETKTDANDSIAEVYKRAEDHMYSNKLVESPSMRNKTVGTIIQTLFEKDKREEEHSARVSRLSAKVGEVLGLPEFKVKELQTVGLLHDIGKIAIDKEIFNKPGALSDDEYAEMKRHSEIGYRILSTVNEMSEMAEYVLAHHERWDGTGYPRGLASDQIPFEARIIAIADSFDAMTSDRVYRDAMSTEAALAELRCNRGLQFDSALVDLFIEHEVWLIPDE